MLKSCIESSGCMFMSDGKRINLNFGGGRLNSITLRPYHTLSVVISTLGGTLPHSHPGHVLSGQEISPCTRNDRREPSGCSSNQTCFLPLPPLVISTLGRNLAIPATPEQAVHPSTRSP